MPTSDPLHRAEILSVPRRHANITQNRAQEATA